MNIKSLLLGSAAALVAVSGARAADAVIAPEPEPVEYVRVCDIYGAGYYYIPGTEICLKVGGYVRYDIGVGELFGEIGETGDDTYYKRGRFALRMEARTETELGTLQGKAQINFQWQTGHAGALTFNDFDGDGLVDAGELGVEDDYDARFSDGMERAWVKLGGFMIGVEDSMFSVWTGYASGVVQDGLIPYGPFTTHMINYTFDAGNGFSVFAGVEEGSDEGFGQIIEDYTPHIVAGAAYKAGLFGLSGVVGWDSVEEEFALKGRIDVTPNEMFSFFVMGAWTDDDGDGIFGDDGGNYYAQWGGDWAVWVGGAVNVNDRVTLNGEFGYNDIGDYSVVVDANLTVVPGFVVTPGVGYKHFDVVDEEQWGGYLRTQFTF